MTGPESLLWNADALLLKAETLLDERRLDDCIPAFDGAQTAGADADRCNAGRWMAWMLLGQFGKAWLESDAIRKRGAPDPNRFWNGEPWHGKRVMVRCLHGFGDAVQFLRYIPLLRAQAAEVIVETAPALVELAEMLDGVDRVITWGEHAPRRAPEWDVQMEVTELPYVFRTEAKDLPLATEYVPLPQAMLRAAQRRVCGRERLQVGVAWSCGEWNLSRSIPLQALKPLLEDARLDSRVEFWNLQGGAVRREWAWLEECGNALDASEFCEDAGLLPLACFMAQMDLIVTVDTVTAHLGGALGIPTWLLLRYDADWRWMVGRDDSPWYPSLRLFRQDEERNWTSVVDAVRQQLAEWHGVAADERAVA